MGADEKELEDVLRIKKRRLAELKKQLARLGYGAPPELRTEVDDLQAEIDKDKKVLEPIIKGDVSDDALAGLKSYGVSSAVSTAILMVEQGLYDLRKEFRDYRDQRNRELQIDHSERETRQMHVDSVLIGLNAKIERVSWRQWLTLLAVAIIVTYLVTRGLS